MTEELPPAADADAAAAPEPVQDTGVITPPSTTSPIAEFDAAVDRLFDPLRGNPIADRAFYAATHLGDFSLIWHLLGAARAVRSDDDLHELVRFSSVIGFESLLVNQGIKRLFRRARPVYEQERPHRLRKPQTTSFPSGHASSAFVAAAVLSRGTGLGPAYYALAAFVASSRVYVRIHHASDVVGGAVVGIVLGQVARKVLDRIERGSAPE